MTDKATMNRLLNGTAGSGPFTDIRPGITKVAPRKVHKQLRGVEDNSRAGLVELSLSTDKGAPFATVTVFSAVKPNFMRVVRVKDQGADDRNARAVCIAAGAAAEGLCEQFGDHLDPEACAATALKLFNEAIKKLRLEDACEVKGRMH